MDLGRRVFIARRILLSYSRSQYLCIEPNPVRIVHHTRSYVKDKGRGKSKKHRISSAYTPRPILKYSHGRNGPKAKYNVPGDDDDSNTIFSGRWKIAAGVIFLATVAVTSLGLRSSQKISDWTPHPPRKGMSLEVLSRNHRMWTEMWKKSAEYQDLVTFFESLFDNDSIEITACMCLCLGTLSGRSWTTAFDSCDAAMSQLVALESMVELLRTKYKIGNILLQDPAFNALDIKFLRERGFTVFETPQDAFDYVPPTTFVFLPQAIFEVIERTIQIVNPPLLLASDLRKICHHRNPQLSYLRPTLMPFLAQRMEKALPHSAIAHWWGRHVIYYRPNSTP